MPIRPFLADRRFDPETIEVMSAAFADACAALGLIDRDDAITRIVAGRIIELAQSGIRTQTALYTQTVEEFKSAPM